MGEAASSPPACSEPAESGRPPMPVLTAETEITGALLQQARMALGWTLEKLVDVTKISIYYLRNLEREDTSDLPAPVYMRGYLRLLAKIYKLDPARFVEGYLDRLEKIKKAQ